MRIRPVWAFVVAAAFSVAARAQEDEEGSGAPQSRQMKTAVMFYERGDDMQAMDRFMDILVKGDPSERASANEYLNLITHRMNIGTKDFKRPSPPPAIAGWRRSRKSNSVISACPRSCPATRSRPSGRNQKS